MQVFVCYNEMVNITAAPNSGRKETAGERRGKLMRTVLKKLTAVMLAVAMFCTCVPADAAKAASYADFTAEQMLIVTAPDGVNMHQTPQASAANRIMTLGRGNHLYVNQVNYQTGWMLVTCGGHTGWVLGQDGWFAVYNAVPDVYSYAQTMQAKVLASALNVHRDPVKLSSNIIDDLYRGQVVDAVGYTNTGWTKVRYYRGGSQIEGYVSSAWVNVTAKVVATAPEKFTTIYGYSAAVKSNCSALNVHCSPSTAADVMTCIYSGDVVNILAQSKTWYRISLNVNGNMRTGYIYRSYTNKKDALANLRLSAANKTVKRKGKYHILIRGNTGMSLKATWKTSNKKVATVNKNGYVTAKKKGTAKITCTIKVGNRTKKLTCKIKVK